MAILIGVLKSLMSDPELNNRQVVMLAVFTKRMILLLAVLVSGCSTVASSPSPRVDVIFAEIKLVDEIKERKDALGLSRCKHNVCQIQIRRDVYPLCITHEVMHGFSGSWHSTNDSTEYCLVER
jgi:hypothetical protein